MLRTDWLISIIPGNSESRVSKFVPRSQQARASLRLGFEFSCDECNQVVYRIQVARHNVLILHSDAETILKVSDQIEDSHGVDYIPQQGPVVTQTIGTARQEVTDEKVSNFAFDVLRVHGSTSFGHFAQNTSVCSASRTSEAMLSRVSSICICV